MEKIMQNGYTFTYVNKVTGKPTVQQEWSVERVAAFMFLVEFHRTHSQRYIKDYTLMNKYASKAYVFDSMEFDEKTFKDLNKMTRDITCVMGELVDPSKVSPANYTPIMKAYMMPTWEEALDFTEQVIKDYIAGKETDTTLTTPQGTVTIPAETYLTRPTEEEYAEQAKRVAEEEMKKAQEQAQKRVKAVAPRTATQAVKVTGDVVGKYLIFDFIKHGPLKCKVVGTAGRSYVCEVYKDDLCIDPACKIGFTSKRIVSWC